MSKIEKMQANTDITISIPHDIEKYRKLGVLNALLRDQTTKGNIVWATNAYEYLGKGFGAKDFITEVGITGENAANIRRRAQKDKDERAALTRTHAEVFTPTWIVKMMVDAADEDWRESLQLQDGQEEWQAYIRSPRLEITCGEAPYLVNRYDAADGNVTPLTERTGILSRKLALVNEHVKTREEWILWAKVALKSIYGYEFQGDNLLIARVNVLCTLEDFLAETGFDKFSPEEYTEIADIISWNIWQMDGLTKCIPFGTPAKDKAQATLFDLLDGAAEEETHEDCVIYDWKQDKQIEFASIRKGGDMKFDYIIGNPPYQEEAKGANANDTPVYHHFYNGAFELSDCVELISPARFLFNAGGTPKEWNQRMLEDPHNSVLFYEPESSKVFPNTSISGGVAVIYHDEKREIGPINTFTPFPELNAIVDKADACTDEYLSSIVTNRGIYKYSDIAYAESPEELALTADRRLAPSAFERMPRLFTKNKPNDGKEYIRIYGVIDNKRSYRWFRRDYINPVDNLDKWKVVVSKADGAAGQLGKPIPARICGKPTVLEPGVGFAETFIAVGAVETQDEAEAICKYIKTKFARTLLGVLKVTQNNAKPTWQKIPLLDFTKESEINWTLSIEEIDTQLYKKYNLTADEIKFIETYVKAMD